jgi:hypothetical protein
MSNFVPDTALPISGALKFSQLQNQFNPGAPLTSIKLSHYYVNSDHSLNTYGVPGIPSKNNPIKLSQFHGKSVYGQNLIKNGYNIQIFNSSTNRILLNFEYNAGATNLIKINNISNTFTFNGLLLVGGGGASFSPIRYNSDFIGYGGGGGFVYHVIGLTGNIIIDSMKTVYTIVVGNGGNINNLNGGNSYIINNNTGQILFNANGGTKGDRSPFVSISEPDRSYGGDSGNTIVNRNTGVTSSANYFGGRQITNTDDAKAGAGAGGNPPPQRQYTTFNSSGNPAYVHDAGPGYISNITGTNIVYAGGGAGAASANGIFQLGNEGPYNQIGKGGSGFLVTTRNYLLNKDYYDNVLYNGPNDSPLFIRNGNSGCVIFNLENFYSYL